MATDWNGLPNYPGDYEAKGVTLSDFQRDPRFAELLAYQSQEMSVLVSRHAVERIKLGLSIKDQRVDEEETEV